MFNTVKYQLRHYGVWIECDMPIWIRFHGRKRVIYGSGEKKYF